MAHHLITHINPSHVLIIVQYHVRLGHIFVSLSNCFLRWHCGQCSTTELVRSETSFLNQVSLLDWPSQFLLEWFSAAAGFQLVQVWCKNYLCTLCALCSVAFLLTEVF